MLEFINTRNMARVGTCMFNHKFMDCGLLSGKEQSGSVFSTKDDRLICVKDVCIEGTYEGQTYAWYGILIPTEYISKIEINKELEA